MKLTKTKKPKFHIDLGEGLMFADFYVNEKKLDNQHNYLRIYSPNGVFSLKVVGETFLILLGAAHRGEIKEIQSYAYIMWRLSTELYLDQSFGTDIIDAIVRRDKKIEELAKEKADEVTDTQEAIDDAFMRDVIDYANKSDEEREEAKEEMRQVVKNIIKETKEEEV